MVFHGPSCMSGLITVIYIYMDIHMDMVYIYVYVYIYMYVCMPDGIHRIPEGLKHGINILCN